MLITVAIILGACSKRKRRQPMKPLHAKPLIFSFDCARVTLVPHYLIFFVIQERLKFNRVCTVRVFCCMPACTAFIDHLASALIVRRSIDGGISACRFVGHLVVFLVFSYGVNPDDDDDDDVVGGCFWSASRVSAACVLAMFVLASLCYLSAEISLRLRQSVIGVRDPTLSTQRRTSHGPSAGVAWASSPSTWVALEAGAAGQSGRTQSYRYVAVAKHLDDDLSTNSWLPHVDPVAPPRSDRVKPLYGSGSW